MSKLVAFIGGPRKNGFSTQLLEQVVAGAAAAGAETKVYNLNEDGVKGCQGCMYCRTHDGCATKDKLQPMYQDIAQADGIVANFPIYFMNITGQAKQWLDRLFPLMDASFTPRHPGKKLVTIYAQGSPDPNACAQAMDANDTCLKMMGWQLLHRFLLLGTSAPDMAIPQATLDEAFEAGRRLVL